MVDDEYMREIQRFAEAATRDRKLWQTIAGQNIEHSRFGRGIVARVDSGSTQVYLDIVFQDLPEPESRKTFGSVALMNGMISGLDLSSATLPDASVGETPQVIPGVVEKEPGNDDGAGDVQPVVVARSRDEEKFWEMVGEKTTTGKAFRMLIGRFRSMPGIRVAFKETAYSVILDVRGGDYYSLFHMNRKGELNVWIRVLRRQFAKSGLDANLLQGYIREMKKILHMPEGRDELTFDVDFVDMDRFLESVDRLVAGLRSQTLAGNAEPSAGQDSGHSSAKSGASLSSPDPSITDGPSMIGSRTASTEMVREYRFGEQALSEWIELSLGDHSTVQWLTNANLPGILTLGPCHAGQGAVFITEGDCSRADLLLAYGEAAAWNARNSRARNFASDIDHLRFLAHEGAEVLRLPWQEIGDNTLTESYARVTLNRKAWHHLFMRFTVYARWSKRENYAGPRPRKPSGAVLKMLQVLNAELIAELDLSWDVPVPVNDLVAKGYRGDAGGVYLFSINAHKGRTPLYAGITVDFGTRFSQHSKEYSIGSNKSSNKIHQTEQQAEALGLGLDSVDIHTAQLPLSWRVGPAKACYFREPGQGKETQIIWTIDNLLASRISGSMLPLNTERSKNRRLKVSMSGNWPGGWPLVIISPDPKRTADSVYGTTRSGSLEIPLWD